MEHFDNVLIFSFKDQTFLTVKEFIEVFDTFFLKKVEENLQKLKQYNGAQKILNLPW